MPQAQTIEIPRDLELPDAIMLARSIYALPPAAIYVPDFTHLRWIEPFAMLLLSQAFCDLKDRNPDSAIIARTPDSDACGYAKWMGFFKAARLQTNDLQAPGNENYLPITFIPVNQRVQGALNHTEDVVDIAKKLAIQLIRQDSGALVDAVSYAFREMLRNVVEHSQSDTLGYCAQYWSRGPKANRVEIAIIDSGVGLRQTLSQNPHLTIGSDRDAIMYALAPGVSGKFYKGIRNNPKDIFQNSGFGLYMNYRLCNEGGSFFIASGETGLLRQKEQDNQYHDTGFRGTILRLQLNALMLDNSGSLIDRFVQEGELLAASFGNNTAPNPSAMSKMLKDDFVVLQKTIQVGDRVVHQQHGEGTVLERLTLSTNEEGAMVEFDKTNRRRRVTLDTLIPVSDI